jgi:MFS family permease
MALARVAFGYQYQTVATLAPDLIAAYRLDYTDIGWLIGIFVAPGIAIALPLGLLGGRFGEGRIMAAGLLLMTAGPLLAAVAAGPLGIGAGRLFAGIGAVAMMVLQNKIISDWFTGRRFMLAISISVAAYPIGVSGAQIVLPALVARTSLSAGFLSDSALIGLATVLFLASYRAAPGAPKGSRRFSLPSRRECALVMVAGLIWTAYTGCYGGFVSYVPSLMSVRGAPELLTALIMIIATWGNLLPTLAGGALAARFGGFPVLLFGAVAMSAGCAFIGLGYWPVVSAVLFGVLGSVQPSVIMAAGTLSARPENRSAGLGLFYTTYYAGNALIPALCGRAADAVGSPAGALYAAAAFGLLAIPVWLLHVRLGASQEARHATPQSHADPPRREASG